MVAGDAVYTAEYDSVINQYAISFVNYDGIELQSGMIDYGQMPAYNGETPVKPANVQYTYTFKGWSPEVVMVAGDAVYTAEYDSVINQYAISFVNYDGAELQSGMIDYGQMPAYNGNIPVKPANVQYTYTFKGWSPEVVMVAGDAVYTAEYDSVINSYTIIFLDEDGTELCRGEWSYGEMPSCDEPEKAEDELYWYSFANWTPEIVPVNGEAVYTAVYNAIEKGAATYVDNLSLPEPAKKVIIDDKIYILRGDKIYSITGQLVE